MFQGGFEVFEGDLTFDSSLVWRFLFFFDSFLSSFLISSGIRFGHFVGQNLMMNTTTVNRQACAVCVLCQLVSQLLNFSRFVKALQSRLTRQIRFTVTCFTPSVMTHSFAL